ncbi:MAG: P-aminobenzoate N-oxygenase AurF [Bdellovibrionales bacterium]|nr:P-aminobenzoate N-oxygenase AurF [Bdellovibrionales bacterium]
MNRNLSQTHTISLADDQKTMKRIEIALKRSKELDQTAMMDIYSKEFNYETCKHEMWNPEKFSLLYKTWIWEQATPAQKIKLNQLFWVAYYSQIISAEIATIFFNQTSAASLYGIEDFRVVCDTLDLESAQERGHIHAFKLVSEKFEQENFGERIFTYPMRSPFEQTMLYANLNEFQKIWRKWQLRTFSLISSNSAFIGCQYFTVRGLRTLNGKIVQHQLSKFYTEHADKENSPIPSKISYSHFIDESFHFNTSTIISHDVINSLAKPTKLETLIGNLTLKGCQQDHYNFSTAINGIFWFDPALYGATYKILRSQVFGMNHDDAMEAIRKSYCEENDGMLASYKTHRESVDSYRAYLQDFQYINAENKNQSHMASNTIQKHLNTNRKAFTEFKRKSA